MTSDKQSNVRRSPVITANTERGLGSWGGGSQPPPHQLGDLGERCKVPIGVLTVGHLYNVIQKPDSYCGTFIFVISVISADFNDFSQL